jgi:hypothetical protein
VHLGSLTCRSVWILGQEADRPDQGARSGFDTTDEDSDHLVEDARLQFGIAGVW